MATDFAMQYESVKQLAKQVGSLHRDFSGMIQTLDNLVDSFNGQWVGTAHDEFVTAYKKLRPKLNSISSVMGNYESTIRKGADRQLEMNKELSKIFNGIVGIISGILDANDQHVTAEPNQSNNGRIWTDVHSVETPLNSQHTNYTCAFASGSMLLNAIGISATEEDIYQLTGGDNNLYQVNKAMNQLSGERFEEVYCNRSIDDLYAQITSSLDKGTPVQINVRMPSKEPFGYPSDGHYVVITGVYTDENGNRMVRINDPFSPQYYSQGIKEGQQIDIPLSSLFDVWGHTWLIVGK